VSVNNITALKVPNYIQEEFEDTKGVIKISVNKRTMAKRTNKAGAEMCLVDKEAEKI
jgi:hypothetical protein